MERDRERGEGENGRGERYIKGESVRGKERETEGDLTGRE